MTKTILTEIHYYLKNNWYDSDHLTDFNMAIDSGYTEYAAYLVFSAGAIDPETSFNPKIEEAIERMLLKYTKKQCKTDLKECFGNALVYVNSETNEHAFIKNDYVDYLVDIKDMGPNWKIS